MLTAELGTDGQHQTQNVKLLFPDSPGSHAPMEGLGELRDRESECSLGGGQAPILEVWDYTF